MSLGKCEQDSETGVFLQNEVQVVSYLNLHGKCMLSVYCSCEALELLRMVLVEGRGRERILLYYR